MSLFFSLAGKLVLLSFAVAVAVTVYLFGDGERGANTATILSFTCSAVATAVTLYTLNAQQGAARAVATPLSGRARTVIAVLLTIGVVVPATAWARNRWFADLTVCFGASAEVRENGSQVVTPHRFGLAQR